MKKALTLLAMGLVLVMLITACGQTTSTSLPVSTSQIVESEPEPEVEPEPEDEPDEDEQPEAGQLDFVGEVETPMGAADAVFSLQGDGTYLATVALGSLGSVDISAGTWEYNGDTLVLTDEDGETFTATENADGLYEITGVWDVGSMPDTDITVTAGKAEVEAFLAGGSAAGDALELVGEVETPMGAADAVFALQGDGTYLATVALGALGSVDISAGTWEHNGDALVLTDEDGETFTSAVNADGLHEITGVWDVGSMPGMEITVVAATADISAYIA